VTALRETTIEGRGIVLGFDSAVLTLDPALPPTRPIDLIIEMGAFVVVDAIDARRSEALADACVGLASPVAGRISFLDKDWQSLSPDAANAMRGRIGRVFGAEGWIDWMSVLDNVLIAQRHHTRRREVQLAGEAAWLARRFGLPGIPLDRPSSLAAADLERAALVRAFLGRPRLVVLEHAAGRLRADIVEPLINAVRAARDRGAAVLWLATDPAIWDDSSIPATRRLRLVGGEFVEARRTA
jgi:phospholipid/cholesterol/gamma-HCH transport system ATP-binding protein